MLKREENELSVWYRQVSLVWAIENKYDEWRIGTNPFKLYVGFQDCEAGSSSSFFHEKQIKRSCSVAKKIILCRLLENVSFIPNEICKFILYQIFRSAACDCGFIRKARKEK